MIIFSKAKFNGLEHTKIKLINQGKWNSPIDNSNWDKISEGIIKKIHIWNIMRLSFKGKKIIVNQILSSKLCYIGQIYIFLWNGKKLPRHLAQLFIWRVALARFVRHKHSIKFSKLKMYSKVVKSHQCSLER